MPKAKRGFFMKWVLLTVFLSFSGQGIDGGVIAGTLSDSMIISNVEGAKGMPVNQSQTEAGKTVKLSDSQGKQQDKPIRTKVLYNFAEGSSIDQWRPVNDTVMGGRSRSTAQKAETGPLRFTGILSLENNGGFASLRSFGPVHDLTAYDGLILRLRGDGKRYYFNLRNSQASAAANFRLAFDTRPGQWIEVRIPFSQLQAVWRGQNYPYPVTFDPSRIVSMGILIADKQQGPFELEIEWIKAYQEN